MKKIWKPLNLSSSTNKAIQHSPVKGKSPSVCIRWRLAVWDSFPPPACPLSARQLKYQPTRSLISCAWVRCPSDAHSSYFVAGMGPGRCHPRSPPSTDFHIPFRHPALFFLFLFFLSFLPFLSFLSFRPVVWSFAGLHCCSCMYNSVFL